MSNLFLSAILEEKQDSVREADAQATQSRLKTLQGYDSQIPCNDAVNIDKLQLAQPWLLAEPLTKAKMVTQKLRRDGRCNAFVNNDLVSNFRP
ncbi:unnamed protein product [Dovyalis caffra]|uniref:Uncharacterized protein n=1 Tax=Dovyalis caffra TaxID=77055 RepID=A0AAV1RIA2_9ROSI|nr:unnamed protein product [Dovyalis caffra]